MNQTDTVHIKKNLISDAIEFAGIKAAADGLAVTRKSSRALGLKVLAEGCGVTHQSVRKWEKNSKLPRTEWTGETQYSTTIERLTNGAVTRQGLLDLNKPN